MKDDALKFIAELPRLEHLLLPATVTERGLQALRRLPHLKGVSIEGGVGDVGAAFLCDFGALEDAPELTRVTDAGMRDLGRITNLKSLDLSKNKGRVTDAGIGRISGLYGLERLDLRGAIITDGAMETIVTFHALRDLKLSGHGITDAGLAAH